MNLKLFTNKLFTHSAMLTNFKKILLQPMSQQVFAGIIVVGIFIGAVSLTNFLNNTVLYKKVAQINLPSNVWYFNEGLACVQLQSDSWWFFIDWSGRKVFDLESAEPSAFSEGLARVMIGGQYGFINKTGQMVIKPVFENAGYFHNGLAPVRVNDKWGVIDRTGKIIIIPKYSEQPIFNEGLIGNSRNVITGL